MWRKILRWASKRDSETNRRGDDMKSNKLEISEVAFWSDNFEALDPIRDASYIIARVMDSGTHEDRQKILDYYSSSTIKDALLQAAELSPATIAWTCLWLELEPQDFYCIRKKGDNPNPFAYI